MDAVLLGPEMAIAALAGGTVTLATGAGIAFLAGGASRAWALGCVGIGGALIALPWMTQSPPPPAAAPVPAIAGMITVSADGRRTVAQPEKTPPPPLPGREAARIAIEATEAEPNNTTAGANVAPLGISILGQAAEGDSDIFAFDIPARHRDVIVASLTTRDASAALVLYDDAGRPLGTARTIDEIRVRVATLERGLEAPRYYVQVLGLSHGPAEYQLTVTQERR
jgi:hypothetical protein